MDPFGRAIGLWVVRCSPDLLDSQEATHCCNHFACEPGSLVRHKPLGEPKHGEILIVEYPGCGPHCLIPGNISLNIPGKVIYDHQHVLHHQFLLCRYCDLHSNIIDMYQLHGLGTDNRLHARYLRFCFKLLTASAVGHGHHKCTGHPGPSEPFFH